MTARYRGLLVVAFAAGVGCTSSGNASTTIPGGGAETAAPSPGVPARGRPITLPAHLEGDRFYIEGTTTEGYPLRFFTATGGGLFITQAAVDRAALPTATIDAGDGTAMIAARFPDFDWDAWIPHLDSLAGRIPVLPDVEARVANVDADGILGMPWFKDRSWTFDYGKGEMLLRAQNDLPRAESAHRISLGFPVDPTTKARVTSYARVSIEVDGAVIDLLLDTGATVELTPAAVALIDPSGPARRGTCFVTQTIFETWRAKHPEWRVVEGADRWAQGEPMIEVPRVNLASFAVGPVWFTRRPDQALGEISQFTDKPVSGALGGSALKYFRVHIDYPAALAAFELASSPPADGE
ncbi:MAG: hypothetical protein U0271_01045 [Polyangiaceae bacterium]